MAIKKAQANFDVNGTGQYDTLHYETQLKQVKKVNASGVVTGDLEAELTRIDSDVDVVDAKVENNKVDIAKTKIDVGTVSTLTTTAKTVVPAINELKTKNGQQDTVISGLDTRLTQAEQDIDNHNHDNVYLKLSGGSVTGDIVTNNDKGLKTKNTSGVAVNVAKVNSGNVMALGDSSLRTVLHAVGANLKVHDGTNEYTVFHSGNMGHGSGINADMLDGVEGSNYARTDTYTSFKKGMQVGEGFDMVMKAMNGSSDAGDLVWQKGDGTQLGRVTVDTGGNMVFWTGGSLNNHIIRATGEFYSTHEHIMQSQERETRVRFQRNGDSGIGLFMNPSGQFGTYDWHNSKLIYDVDRARGEMQFSRPIKVQGKRVYIQPTAPNDAVYGDIWIQS